MDILDRLYDMLSPHCTDAVLANGPRLTDRGQQKVAKALGISTGEVGQKIAELAERMKIAEGVAPRYTYEDDATGSVTVRDTKTAKERFLSGQDASKLHARLEKEPEQQVLASYFILAEDVMADIVPDELAKDFGTFNFPHKDMIATVAYSVRDSKPHLEVVSLRTHDGDEVEMTEGEKIALTADAVKWIPEV